MTRTFSLPSEALGFYLGYALYHYDEVAIVSPWVSDVQVTFPVNDLDLDRRLYLSEAIDELSEGTKVKLYLRSGQDHNHYITSKLDDSVDTQMVDDLHAKAIVTPESVYVGSANVTLGGLSINRELCQLVENDYDSIEAYIAAELEL